MVEEFSKRLVTGWISLPADAPPTKVDLYLGRLKVASTYATEDGAMSGSGSALRGGKSADAPREALVHKWQVPMIKGPADDRRNSRQQVRTFAFRVRGIWPYVNKNTKISVRVAGRPLPIYKHGMFLSPRRNGAESMDVLRERLKQGYLLTQWGHIALSKKLDTEWQETVMNLYQRTRKILADEFGYDEFFVYGTLLGAVREGGYIGHDVDFDAAYVSKETDGRAAAHEFQQIALALIEHGLDVDAHVTALHITDPEDPGHRIDLFHTYFDDAGVMRFPFGVAGSSTVTRDDWQGTKSVDFPGGSGLVPVNDEQMVAHLYGEDWRQPKPGFNWNLDRTDSAPEGHLSPEQRTKVYWANFYSRNRYTSGSTFFEFVNALPELPQNVLDIGCGDGRDSCAFGAAGRTVLGVDQSPVGIEHASAHAAEVGLSDKVAFRTCDVADTDDVGRAMEQFEEKSAGPVAFYMRFFLHAIPEQVQADLMKAIETHARPGDWLVAEFRTDKDEANAKVHTKHYRRFQNAEAFRDSLHAHGFEVTHFEEGTGLSPYKGEDPVLCRVVARR
jgi:SAM-dependent methyltransferase